MAGSPGGSIESHALLSDRGNLRRRRAVSRAVEVLSTLATLLAVAVLIIVVGSVLARGIGSINIDFLTKGPAPFGESGGGIANAIVGSAMLVGLASAIAIPVGLLIAIFTTEFADNRFAAAIRFALDILNGVPTIITGIFILGLIVIPQGKQSGFAGSIALAIIMLPIVARAGQEVLSLVPNTLKEAATALGVARWRIVMRIVLPTAAGGLLTGSLLAVARVAGETAPLLLRQLHRLHRDLNRLQPGAGLDPPLDLPVVGVAESRSTRSGMGGGLHPDPLRSDPEHRRAGLLRANPETDEGMRQRRPCRAQPRSPYDEPRKCERPNRDRTQA